jgi:hypothetical protein
MESKDSNILNPNALSFLDSRVHLQLNYIYKKNQKYLYPLPKTIDFFTLESIFFYFNVHKNIRYLNIFTQINNDE